MQSRRAAKADLDTGMKILFITPLLKSYAERWMPLGVCSMAAHLKNRGHDVSLFDRTAAFILLGKNRHRLKDEMEKQVSAFHPDMIAFSTVSPAIYDTIDCVDTLRRSYRGILIAGGHHATALPLETLEKIPGLDAVIAGEGEYSLAAFAENGDTNGILGLYRRGAPPHETRLTGRITDLDDLPFPLLDLLDLSYYTQPNSATIRGFNLSTASMLTARGCYYSCSYCAESLTYGRGVRFHSPNYVVENIQKILKDYPVNGLYFLDNDFLADPARAEKICSLMIEQGLHKKVKWACQTRTDRLDTGIIQHLKAAGCVKLELGIESFNPIMLENINKATNINGSQRALKLCKESGLTVHAYMLTGLENETFDDLRQQLSRIRQLQPDSFSWNRVNLYPGTRLYNDRGNRFFETHEWSRELIDEFFEQDFLTAIHPEKRKRWENQHLKPYMWRTLTFSHLRNNDLKFIVEKIMGRNLLQILFESFRQLKQRFSPGN